MNIIKSLSEDRWNRWVSPYLTPHEHLQLALTSKTSMSRFYQTITQVGITLNSFNKLMHQNRGKGLDKMRSLRKYYPRLERLDVALNRSALIGQFTIQYVQKATSTKLPNSPSLESALELAPSLSNPPSNEALSRSSVKEILELAERLSRPKKLLLKEIGYGAGTQKTCFTIGLLDLEPNHQTIINAKFWLKALQQLGYCKDSITENADSTTKNTVPITEDDENSQPSLTEHFHLNIIHDCLQALQNSGINPHHVKFLDEKQFRRIISVSKWKEISQIMVKQLFVIFSENKPHEGMSIENYFVAGLWMNQWKIQPSNDCPDLHTIVHHLYHLVIMDGNGKKCFRVCSRSQAEAYLKGLPNPEQNPFFRTAETRFKIDKYGLVHFFPRQVEISSQKGMKVTHHSIFEYFVTDTRQELILRKPAEKPKLKLKSQPLTPLEELSLSIAKTHFECKSFKKK